jgi:hypothetical protein
MNYMGKRKDYYEKPILGVCYMHEWRIREYMKLLILIDLRYFNY